MQPPDINSGPEASYSVSSNIKLKNQHIKMVQPPDINLSLEASTSAAVDGAKLDMVESALMGDYLAWPDSPTRKGKLETERFPFAITAKRFRKMHIKNGR
ncbi:hypothetical protein JTB14_034732 [Gonioctena quinquepunctata]|nr:hypothetical protein JTB14_034732 [Gonioctena quinquepunctata]